MARITNENEKLIYLNKRRRKARVKRRLIFIGLVLSVILCVVFFAPIFSIDKFVIEGNEVVSNEEILSATGASVGDNMFLTNMRGLKADVEKIPYVRSAKIVGSLKTPTDENPAGGWGNCSLRIEIEEETPYLYIISESGYIYLNSEGRILEITNITKEGINLKLITPLRDDFEVGDNYFKNDKNNLGKYIAIIKEIEDNNMMEGVRDIIIDSNGDISVHIKALNVVFGTAENLDYKMNMVIQAITELGENPRGTLDVTRGSKIYYSTDSE